MNKITKIITGVITVMAITGFVVVKDYFQTDTHNTPSTTITDPVNKHNTDLFNKHIIDTAVAILRTGDIVLRSGIGADSYLLSMLNQKDKTYSHCGIVMIENGYPYIYHSIGGEDNPDERMRRDSARVFFSPLHNTGLAIVRYDYGEDKISKLRTVVTQYYKTRPKFDMKFDLATDDKLYCSELVYKAINRATGDTAYIGTSSISGNRFVAIDNLFINPHAHIVWQTKFKQYLYSLK